ncbi:MAG: hypothetical protein WCD47_09195 [Candidatus Sulfotelmatobacter sp.]
MAKPITPRFIPWSELDFWNDPVVVQAMNWQQRHLYRALLLKAHVCATRPYLPDDDNQLWLLADAGSLKNWMENRDAVLQKFTREEIEGVRVLSHKRVLRDWTNTVEHYENKREAARKGGLAKQANKEAAELSTCLANGKQPLSKRCLTETDTEADNSLSHKLSQSPDQSVCSSNGDQPQSQPSQCDSANPPTQNKLSDLFRVGVDALTGARQGENPIQWVERMCKLWDELRREMQTGRGDGRVEAEDFRKLSSASWQRAAKFNTEITRPEIEFCMRWALKTSKYWSKPGKLEGTAGFVNAFGVIRNQCMFYYSQVDGKKRARMGVPEQIVSFSERSKIAPKPDTTMKEVMQELHEDTAQAKRERDQKERMAALETEKARRVKERVRPLRPTEIADMMAAKRVPNAAEVEMPNVSDL